MYCEHGRLIIEKCLTKDDEEVKTLYNKNKNRTIAFHLRNQSLGPVTLENSHPFIVTSKDWGHKTDIALMHNGTIRDIQVDTSLSDSHNLAAYFLRPIFEKHPRMYMDAEFWNLVGALIGKNKLVLLDNNERFIIVNSAMGAILEPFGTWASSEVRLSPIRMSATGSKEIPYTPADKGIPKGMKFDGYWVADETGIEHFRAMAPKITLESLTGANREQVYDLVDKFPTLATDFLMGVIENANQ